LKTGQLVSGVPFVVIAEGKPMYKGVFTTSVSSRSFSCPVIVIDSIASKAVAAKDQLSIGLGYPAATFFHGDDPRFDPRIHTALRAAGKLTKGPDDHIQWLAESLREMETIKPGMTRADLLRVFAEEAGLSTRIQRRYAYRDFIKVDVKFEPARSPEDKLTEHSEDKIRDISRPFLEWSIQD
jgi:hypothetical protein